MFSSVTLAFPDSGEQSFPLYYLSGRNDHWKRPWLIKDSVAFLVRGKVLPHAPIFLAANSNPCEHAGKCVNTEGSFHCECLKGYTGPRCEMDINECHSNPCQNDATCLDKIGGFTCLCMPGEGRFWLGRGFQKCGKKSGGTEGRLPTLLRWNTKLQWGEAKWNTESAFCGGSSQADLAFVWGGRKQLKDWERNQSLHPWGKVVRHPGVCECVCCYAQ